MLVRKITTQNLNFKLDLEKDLANEESRNEEEKEQLKHWLQRIKENQEKRQNTLRTRCNYCKNTLGDSCDSLIVEDKKQTTKALYSRLRVDEKNKVS